MSEAHAAMQGQHFITAEEKAVEAGELNSDNSEAWLLAGDAAYSMENWEESIAYYEKAIAGKGRKKFRADAANRAAAVWSNEIGDPSKAIETFKQALEIDPGQKDALDGLAFVLSVSGRRWESAQYFLELIKRTKQQVGHMHGIGVLENVNYEIPLLQYWVKNRPDDPNGHLGLGRIELDQNRPDMALPHLRKAVELDSTLLEAQARLGQALVDAGTLGEVAAWHEQLPENADSHPEIWIARAMWRDREGDSAGASRCYLEALKINPNHRQAAFTLVKLLNSEGQREAAQEMASYADKLLRYQEQLVKVQQQPENLPLLHEASAIAKSLGRYWEARGWIQVIMLVTGEIPQLTQEVDELNQILAEGPPQNLYSSTPMSQISFDQFQLPNWNELEQVASTNQTEAETGAVSNDTLNNAIQFEDIGQRVGLDFEYFNGEREGRVGPRITEVDGGGVAVLDFDLDGWPDLFFTQGNYIPREDGEGIDLLDQLYMNQAGEQVLNVTEIAGIVDLGFGQGVTVSDYDQDGFPDLMIANLGENKLFQNQGDGTFVDVTNKAGLKGSEWSSSLAMADVNADGYVDIYEVNYLKGDDLATRVCPDVNGKPRICPPVLFDAEHDKLYFGNGDGTFRDVSEEVGIRESAGKGLGIVIADFENRNQLDIFVANDVVENAFYRNEPTPEKPFALVDMALLSGVAMDAFGNSQACMGVAVDDVDHDGRIDLFITNFYHESNCLYLQKQPGIFSDDSVTAKLAQPSFDVLGFGTQFIDANLDGERDLIVTNGHIVNEMDLGVPYRMKPQFFLNEGQAKFKELDAQTLGPYFSQEGLGRGLAILDFNRDGKEDFVTSNLSTPASLLVNSTALPEAHYVSINLIGSDSARIPVGARVELTLSEETFMRQLTAGSGYQAANHNKLIFGLGNNESIDKLTVRWPNGEVQVWEDVKADRDITLVENDSAVY